MIKLTLIEDQKIDFVPEKYRIIGEYQHVYVLQIEEQIVVYISLLEYNAKIYSINYLITKPEFRKQGYAQSALSKLLELLDFIYISLEVRDSNTKALNLYLNSGFKIKQIKQNYYTNPTENGLEMIIEK